MNDERVSFPRWWITRARDQLMAMDMPSGPLGDWVFLFREQLNDALNRPDDTTVAAIPASEADLLKASQPLFEAITRFTRCLADLNWRPSRAHLEGARNTMQQVAVSLARLAAPQAQEVHTCSSQYKMRELPDPDCKACTTVSRPNQRVPE